MIPRQLQQRRRAFPVLCLLLQHLAFNPLPLPSHVVGILQLQLRQRVGLALSISPVQRVELVKENAHRHSSVATWCMVITRTCSSSATCSNCPRISGPLPRSRVPSFTCKPLIFSAWMAITSTISGAF